MRSGAPRVVIVGGGVIGAAVAYFLCADPAFRGTVHVLERDPSYARASSALSASSIRQQFSTPVNVRIGLAGIAFLREAKHRLAVDGEAPALGLVEPGYLFLATPAGEATLRENHAVQQAEGAEVELLDPDALGRRFAWLSVAGLALGAHGVRGEGWFDGPALLQAFRRKSRALGAVWEHAQATGFERTGAALGAVRVASPTGVPGTLPADVVVNAAGPWARQVAAWAGIDLPVFARRRSVFVFDCPRPLPGCPLVVDPSGLWFRPERERFLCGTSPAAGEPDPDDAPLEPEHALFDERLWPLLAARVPAFEALRQRQAWAGYYEMNTFDANGLVGPHPAVPNLLLANGFSGHGIQQAPAVGRGLAEWIVHGGWRTLDLSPLGASRLEAGRPLRERNVV